MPNASDVQPQKWENIIILYDDGNYSAIWGNYDGSERRCLGVRWNGEDGCGYPSQGGNPLWYVEPDYLTKQILLTLLDNLCHSVNQKDQQGVKNILIALSEI